MRDRLAAAALVLALLASAALGQSAPDPTSSERPPEKPVEGAAPAPDTAADVPSLAERPAGRPEAEPARDQPVGRLIPPEEPAAAGSAEAAEDSTKPVGKLIPPEEPAAPEPPEEPKGPPIRETLRESDFDYSACLLALHDLGSTYEELPAISPPDQRDCGIARPVRVTEILPGVTLQGGAEMRCDTARSLGFWMRDFVRPAAARLPGAPRLSGVQLGTTYDCRGRVGDAADAKLSEHAFGNAIDISAFTFADGPTLPVEPRQDSGDLVESFQRAVRGAACLEFTTVLGPGANESHNDHLHLDLAARKGGWRLCQ